MNQSLVPVTRWIMGIHGIRPLSVLYDLIEVPILLKEYSADLTCIVAEVGQEMKSMLVEVEHLIVADKLYDGL